MKLAFFVNEVATEIDEYTTTRLAIAAARMGHDAWYVGVGDIQYESGEPIRAAAHRATHSEGDDLTSFLEGVQEEDSQEQIVLDEVDAVMLRNDAIADLDRRPWAYSMGPVFGTMLLDRGVEVVNNPRGLTRASSKLYLERFPRSIRPRTYVGRDPQLVKEFAKQVGPTVLKPLYGAMGHNVFIVEDPDDPNINQMIEAVLEDGYVVAQERVGDEEGADLRLFLLEGRLLEVDGTPAAVRRVPGRDDPRANISVGGKPKPAEIGDRELAIVEAMSQRLTEDGMFFVGIDIVDDKVIEINAETPGGLQSVEHFTKIDFGPAIISALEKRANASS